MISRVKASPSAGPGPARKLGSSATNPGLLRPLAAADVRVQSSPGLTPTGADLLPNSCGTAPGFRCRVGQARLYALPGVPSEMRAMFESHVAPAACGGRSVRLHSLRSTFLFRDQRGQARRNPGRPHGPRAKPICRNDGLECLARRSHCRSYADALSADALLNQDAAEIRRRLGHLASAPATNRSNRQWPRC